MKPLVLLALAAVAALLCLDGPYETGGEPDDAGRVLRQSEHAMVLFERGHFAEAKAAFATVRLEFTQILGPRNPATLSSRNNFAAVLYAMGDYAGAESAQRTALMLREQVLGRLHPDALASRHNLAVTLLSEGKFEDALKNARMVESGRRHMLGRKSPEFKKAARLKKFIEGAMESSKDGNEVPRGGPSGLGGSSTGVA